MPRYSSGSWRNYRPDKGAGGAAKVPLASPVPAHAQASCRILGLDPGSLRTGYGLIDRAVSGYGAADKAQVARMVATLLGLERRPQADAADALAVALCHAQTRRLTVMYAAAVPARTQAPRSAGGAVRTGLRAGARA